MHRTKILCFAAMALSLLLSTAAYGQITPLGDSYTDSADPTTNYGANTLLEVNGATQITYIQFPLSSIPAGASVSQATLKLFINSVQSAGSFNVYYVTGPWSESAITGELAPTLGSAIASNVLVNAEDKNQYILINVTPAVEAWLNGSEPNNGLALVANGAFSAGFDSKENTATGHSPELDVVLATAGNLQWNGTDLMCVQAPAAQGRIKGDGVTGSASANIVSCGGGGGGGGGSTPITGVTAGLGLTGGGTSGNVTLGINTSVVPQLNVANTFTGNQTVNGNLSATGVVTGSGFQIGSNLFDYGSYANANAFLGFAGNTTTTGNQNTAAGLDALLSNTTATQNTAIGSFALAANTTGDANTASGTFALESNTSGVANTASGGAALENNSTGGDNTASGAQALYHNTAGNNNTASGYEALFNNGTGSFNTASGNTALYYNTTGGENTGSGFGAGNTIDQSLMTGSYNSFFGYSAALSTGSISNATAIGAYAVVAESNAVVLGSMSGLNGCTSPCANANIGIGTTAPGATLDIVGNATNTTPVLRLFAELNSNIIVGQGNIEGAANVFRVNSVGEVFADGGYQSSGADFAESMAVAGLRTQYEPGDVLAVDTRFGRRLTLATEPYSKRVAGVYSTKPGLLATPHHIDDPAIADEVPLAVVGIVPCKASAENGAIVPGDLLVSSSKPGRVMKGRDRRRMLGAVVGKALEPLPKGTGTILVLVTLQ